MEPIEPQAGYFFSAARQHTLEKKQKSKKTKKSIFDKILKSDSNENESVPSGFLADASKNISLETLIDDVYSLGDKLKDSQSLEDIKAYKTAVKKLLSYVVDNMISFDQHISGIGIDKRKKYSIINVIDRKLESLVSGIILNQFKQLDILEKLEEIRGLLVDLLS